MKFNSFGQKLAGISNIGHLYVWHVNVPRSVYRREFRPYYEWACHDKCGNDLVFLTGSSNICTVGESSNDHNVCVWDLLFGAPQRSLLQSYQCYRGNGADCIEYCNDYKCIFVGGSKGSLHLFDTRVNFACIKWEHGNSRIMNLDYFNKTNELLIGSLDGNVSIWDVRMLHRSSKILNSLNHKHYLNSNNSNDISGINHNNNNGSNNNYRDCMKSEWKLYSPKAFVNNNFAMSSRLGLVATLGLTDAKWTPTGDILCTGCDGSVKYIKRKPIFTK